MRTRHDIAIVKFDYTALLNGPHGASGAIESLSAGETVRILGESTDGYKRVQTNAGTVGWISEVSLVLGQTPASATIAEYNTSYQYPVLNFLFTISLTCAVVFSILGLIVGAVWGAEIGGAGGWFVFLAVAAVVGAGIAGGLASLECAMALTRIDAHLSRETTASSFVDDD